MKTVFRRALEGFISKKDTSHSTDKSPILFEDLFSKNRIFIGSSSEGKNIASKVISELKNQKIESLPWFDCFKTSRPPLQELEQISLDIDGAILVGTPEDKAIIREQKWSQMRDNVLYEYGLFSGIIGRSKCSLIVPDKEDFRIPSDFLGVSCYKTYNDGNVDRIISEVVSSLVVTLSKPKADETTRTRGQRLLKFVGWIRNESFRLAQDWNKDTSKNEISNRIVSVSGFIQEDLMNLELNEEYKRIEEAVLDAINNFPKIPRRPNYDDIEDGIKSLVQGVRPHPDVLKSLLYYMWRNYRRYCNENCNFHDQDYWYFDYDRFENWPFRYFRDRPVCNCHAWALGAAEAATMFQYVTGQNPLLLLEEWSDRFLPKLNKAITEFERKLHENLFGTL